MDSKYSVHEITAKLATMDEIAMLRDRVRGISFMSDEIICELYSAFSREKHDCAWAPLTSEVGLAFQAWVIEESKS